MNFKKWFFCEASSVAQELKKLKPDEKFKKNADSIFGNIFHFSLNEEKIKEIKNWIIFQLIKFENKREIDFVEKHLKQCRDFLAVRYEAINFKNSDYTLENLIDENEEWHRELRNSRNFGSKGAWGIPFIKFDDGWSWISLDKHYCAIEAGSMGHCGNVGGSYTSNILSLRDEKNVPHLTFIDNGDGALGEMKGRSNSKPQKKYHKYIIELLKSPYFKDLEGGGYAPENNFSIYDLTKSQRDEVYSYNTKLKENSNLEKLFKEKRFYGITDNVIIDYLIENKMITSYLDLKNIDYEDYEYDPKTKKTNIYYDDNENFYEFIKNEYKEIKNHRMTDLIYFLITNNFFISKYAFNVYAQNLNMQFINLDEIKLMSFLYENYRDIFDYIFNQLNNRTKEKFVAGILKSEETIGLEDKYLDYLHPRTIVDLGIHGIKNKGQKLKELLNKYYDFPNQLDMERKYHYFNLWRTGNYTPAGWNDFTYDKETYKMNYNELMSKLYAIINKIKNNQEFSEEEEKIFKYSFMVEKKVVKQIIDVASKDNFSSLDAGDFDVFLYLFLKNLPWLPRNSDVINLIITVAKKIVENPNQFYLKTKKFIFNELNSYPSSASYKPELVTELKEKLIKIIYPKTPE